VTWPTEGRPANPLGWLITVAARRLTDLLRSEQARQRRQDTVSQQLLPSVRTAAGGLPTTPPESLPPGVIALVGWTNRLVVVSAWAWVGSIACHTLKLLGRLGSSGSGRKTHRTPAVAAAGR
jgi:hypothetical protein